MSQLSEPQGSFERRTATVPQVTRWHGRFRLHIAPSDGFTPRLCTIDSDPLVFWNVAMLTYQVSAAISGPGACLSSGTQVGDPEWVGGGEIGRRSSHPPRARGSHFIQYKSIKSNFDVGSMHEAGPDDRRWISRARIGLGARGATDARE